MDPERTFLCRRVDVERTTQISSAGPTKPARSLGESQDGLTHPGRGTLKWWIASRPLTIS
jgi:hypothetical protein